MPFNECNDNKLVNRALGRCQPQDPLDHGLVVPQLGLWLVGCDLGVMDTLCLGTTTGDEGAECCVRETPVTFNISHCTYAHTFHAPFVR